MIKFLTYEGIFVAATGVCLEKWLNLITDCAS